MVEEDSEMIVVAEGLGFPEGPVVMADGSVLVVEIMAGRISRCWGEGRRETVCEPGGGPNGAAIGPDGALYICNNGGIDPATLLSATGAGHEGRIERIDLSTGKVERIYDSCDGLALSGPNDIAFDADGRMWFTDLGKNLASSRENGGLFHASADGHSIRAVHRGAHSYNGVALSQDGATIYVSETYTARLYAFSTDHMVPDHNGRRLIATAPGLVELDSMAITIAGHICVAQLHHGAIVTFAGQDVIQTRAFPDPYTTNIAFGGHDMRTAFITQSSHGRLLRTKWDEPGLRLPYNG